MLITKYKKTRYLITCNKIWTFKYIYYIYSIRRRRLSWAGPCGSRSRKTFLFVMINSFDCLDDLKANFDDTGQEKAAKQFGSKFLNAPWGMLKNVITLIFGAVVLTKLAEIFGLVLECFWDLTYKIACEPKAVRFNLHYKRRPLALGLLL